MQQELVILMGVSCASKSTYAKKFENDDRYKILSSDKLREEHNLGCNDMSVFLIIDELCSKYLSEGYSVVIDASNVSIKRHRRYLNIATKQNVKYNCIYILTHNELWLSNVKKRLKTKWSYKLGTVLFIRKRQYYGLCVPSEKIFDNITYVTKDISINQNDIDEFKQYYYENKDLFLTNPKEFFKVIYENGLLQKVIPELYACYGYNQNNKHHKDTLENHMFNVAMYYNGSEERVWTAVLHDIGKLIEGIREDDGENSSYIGHAGASTELAILILKRLNIDGLDNRKVVEIINRHMYLPYDTELSYKKKKALGEDLLNELVLFREAELSSK